NSTETVTTKTFWPTGGTGNYCATITILIASIYSLSTWVNRFAQLRRRIEYAGYNGPWWRWLITFLICASSFC
ncbi:unnamed protein product, partial [Haemonchus placei]|uniref:G_PROTEIN_RECEP_F2_4 domain-containing protein n=1 Tax=Haemonchus placei TaxID=6290 RepID=A0A0N4X3H8_HAEPC